MMGKPRVNVHVTDEIFYALDAAAKRPGCTKAAIVDAALAAWLSPESDDRRDGAIIRRLESLDRRLSRFERALNILLECFALYLREFFTFAPEIADDARDGVSARGRKRFEDFIETLGRQIASDKSFTRFLMEEFEAREGDFFTPDEIAALAKARGSKEAQL